jgi:PIN domain nuclease of toxin-antitoxin system
VECAEVNFLLDTHIWYWSIHEPRRLSRRVASAMRRSEGKLWLSPMSSWELLVLCRKGRLLLKPDAPTFIADAWAMGTVREAVVTQEVVAAMARIWLPHNDPIDGFLAATARAYGFTLVTADTDIRKGTGFDILAND